jgi:hypothetical protein
MRILCTVLSSSIARLGAVKVNDYVKKEINVPS